MKSKALIYIFILNLLHVSILSAQLPAYQPLRTGEIINLDGKLLESAWTQAESIDDFMQMEPLGGSKPSVQTKVCMIYNDDYLYIGFRCQENEPSKLIRNGLEYDYSFIDDDGVAIVIDSYNDKSTGIVFATNLNDAKRDRGMSQDGATGNLSFNTFWDTKSFVDSNEYTVEMRIPFSSLRFAIKDTIAMGFQLLRVIKRKGENDIYPKCNPDIENPYAKVSLAREMQFQNLKSHTPLYITPYAIANYIENYSLNIDSTSIQKTTSFLQRKNYFKNESLDKLFSNIGLDIKIGLTKNSTLDLTFNTDFSQAEVDNRIINLSKYDVNLPEKRSFFLESDDYFNFTLANDNQLFISRSIGNENGETVPIIAGVRLTGIISGLQTGILSMQTVGIDDVGIKPHNFFALRNEKRFDVRGSYIGSIFTNRINMGSDNSVSNQTIGFDFVKRINSLVTLSGYAVATPTNFNFKSFAQISSFAIALSKHTRKGIFYDSYLNFIGADFMPVMGYIDETDYAEANMQFGYQWIAKEKSSIQYYYIITDNRYRLKSLSGNRETFSTDLRPGLFFKNQAEIVFSVFEYKIDSISYNWQLDGGNAIAAGTYKMFNNSFTAQFPRISNYNAMLNASYGGFYGGKRFYISPIITWHANKHLTFDIIYEYNHIQFKKYLDEERNTLYKSNLIRLGFSYLMSIKFSAKLFTQYDDLTRTVGSNLRFRYNPSSGTDLYIVFNQEANTNRKRLEPKLPQVNSQGVTIKFIKTFGK